MTARRLTAAEARVLAENIKALCGVTARVDVLAPGGVFLFAEEPLRRKLSLRLYRCPYWETMKPWERKLYDWGLLGYLVQDVIDRVPQLGSRAAYAKQAIRDALIEHREYIAEHGEDHPKILGWRWEGQGAPVGRGTSTEADNV